MRKRSATVRVLNRSCSPGYFYGDTSTQVNRILLDAVEATCTSDDITVKQLRLLQQAGSLRTEENRSIKSMNITLHLAMKLDEPSINRCALMQFNSSVMAVVQLEQKKQRFSDNEREPDAIHLGALFIRQRSVGTRASTRSSSMCSFAN